VPRQRRGARGDELRIPLPRDPCGDGHGDRQRGAARGLRGDSRGAAAPRRGRPLQPAPRCNRAPGGVRRAGEGWREAARGRSRPAGGDRGGAAEARPGAGDRGLHRAGRRGGAAALPEAAGGDRGAADGRHEDRRRPLRRGEDVSPPGGEERAGDEEGRRLSRALHGGREGRGCAQPGQDRARHRKGDVHDIGKNIVGVVLGCNSYEVVDLGVMVPRDRILDTALETGADRVGLSGLITPSLDEMVHGAEEMERRGMRLPLLIGGATTSREHTAVKIAPRYHESTVHVLDASRAVHVVASLMDAEKKAALDAENRVEQARMRDVYQQKEARPLDALAVANAARPTLAWDGDAVAKPAVLGRQLLDDVPLDILVPYIDWRFFFTAWELPGRFPQVLDDPVYGAAARDLYGEATRLLDRIVHERLLRARGVYGFWPGEGDGNDIVLYPDGSRARELVRFPMRRQQGRTGSGAPHACLADFVAPAGSGVRDYVGAFAVTAGLGTDELVARFAADHDDYHGIM